MVEQLVAPVIIQGEFGQVTLTHRGWGFTYQPWNVMVAPIQSYSVLGVMVDDQFKPYPGSERYCDIKGTDYETLMQPSPDGKQANVFRTDDVIALHKALLNIQ